MMDAIASSAMAMSAAELSMNYSISMTKKVMDTQEMMAQEMLQMLPPAPPTDHIIDTYA